MEIPVVRVARNARGESQGQKLRNIRVGLNIATVPVDSLTTRGPGHGASDDRRDAFTFWVFHKDGAMSYLPTTDDGLRTWAKNFADRLGELADPTTVGLTAQQLTDYALAYVDYNTKLEAAQEPATRGGASVLAKNESKTALIALSREHAMTVQHYPGVTDEQRFAFGLTIPDSERTPVPPPDFSPDIDMFPPVVRTVKLRLHNEQTIGRRGKPDGAFGATIFSYVGDLPPALDQIDLWKFEMNTGETTAEVTFPSTVPAGATVWFTASWYNRRGEQSPATPPVNVNLPGTLQQVA